MKIEMQFRYKDEIVRLIDERNTDGNFVIMQNDKGKKLSIMIQVGSTCVVATFDADDYLLEYLQNCVFKP